MRIGLFGGSFNPVHIGHLRLAEACYRQARLDRVEFMPAAQQPHKPHGPVANAQHRLAMLQLAIAGNPAFEISTDEIDRGGVSYTVDTLRAFKARRPDARLFLLLGADSLADLPEWREAAAICQLATPLVVRRAGHPEPDYEPLAPLMAPARLAELQGWQIEMPDTPISSSEIQRLIASGEPWHTLVPPAVAQYIERHGLYRD